MCGSTPARDGLATFQLCRSAADDCNESSIGLKSTHSCYISLDIAEARMSELRRLLNDFIGDRAPLLFDWIGDALDKVVKLQFQDLTIDQVLFWAAASSSLLSQS